MKNKKPLVRVQKKTVLGFSIYEKYRTDDHLIRYFAGGILREDVYFSSFGESCRELSLFGLPLWRRCINGNTLSWYIGSNIEISQLQIEDILERELNRLFGEQGENKVALPRHVFVLWANSGEIAMLFSIYMHRLLSKIGITEQEVVFLCTKPYHADMASFYFPNIKTIVAKPKILRYVTHDLKTKTWNVRFFFTGSYFCEFERQAREDGPRLDCIDWMGSYLGLTAQSPVLTGDLNKRLDIFEEAADRKIGKGKKWSNTILILPDSFSCGSLYAEEISAIYDMASDRGFEVVFNESTGNRALTFPELLSKARYAAGIIGIRSGLIDFLNCANIPMFICYRDFPDRGFNTPACSARTVLKMFSLRRDGREGCVEESIAEPRLDLDHLRIWLDSLKTNED